MGSVPLLGEPVLLVLACLVVVVTLPIKDGSPRLPMLVLASSLGGLDTIEHAGDVDPLSDHRLSPASSVRMTLRVPLCVAG